MQDVAIEYVENLYPVYTKPKRIKIVIGGRGSTKSTGIADYVAAKMSAGELWCCAREHQNTIEESVHRTLLDEIYRLRLGGFSDTLKNITHISGGRNFYKGLAKNPTSLKSTLTGVDGLWIEEGEDLSERTLSILTASVRRNAAQAQAFIAGDDVKMPEIIITMNRGSRKGAVAKRFLKRADKELARCGYYEDDLVMIVELNYTDMPEDWFKASGLEEERADDELRLTPAKYRNKWLGDYLDEVDNAIILPEWVDACLDAHRLPHLEKAFKPKGAIIAAHDPADEGSDKKAYAARHGSVVFSCKASDEGDVNDGCDWATENAIADDADWFLWDADGMGVGLKRQVSDSFKGKHTKTHAFRGGLSGSAQDNAKKIFQPEYSTEKEKAKSYAHTFLNNRAQYYWRLARRIFLTYRCVKHGEYIDPAEMISFASEGMQNWSNLKTELCSVPQKERSDHLIQILSKKEMKTLQIESPNEADTVMMLMYIPHRRRVNDGPVKIPTKTTAFS